MDRETELRLLDECVANARGRPPAGDDAERLVPVAEYTDAARFGRERDVLFRASLNLVAHQSELASAGAFLTRELVGAPVLLTRGEDGRARFDLEIFAASLEGYVDALAVPLRDEERAALLHGVEWICLELAARFAADALNESYFGWDRQRYARAGDHNLARARGQRELAREVVATRRERAALLGVDADA